MLSLFMMWLCMQGEETCSAVRVHNVVVLCMQGEETCSAVRVHDVVVLCQYLLHAVQVSGIVDSQHRCWRSAHGERGTLFYQGFWTRMVYLQYITCLRCTILVRNC